MEFDASNLVIAGVTNTSRHNAPDIVYAYPTETTDLPEDFVAPTGLQVSDVILVGPLGNDGLVDMRRASAYILTSPDRQPEPLPMATFRWVNKLGEYQPLANLPAYHRGAVAQWQANKEVFL